MTPEEWEKYKARDKFAEAIAILDNPNWHKDDPWIQHYREEDKDARRAAPERTEGAIASRERDAIGVVISQELPPDKKRELLRRYLAHRNERVSELSLVGLITTGLWSAEQASVYIRDKYPTAGGWYLLLSNLRGDVPGDVRAQIAREILAISRTNPPVYPPTSQPVCEIEAARVLLDSKEESDRDLIRWAVRQYPSAPLLWAAVSRLPADEETARLARAVYGDASRTQAARLAAAVAFGKDDPQVMHSVAEEIMVSVREFGSREHMLFIHERMRDPAEPTGAERARKGFEVEGLLAAANELPQETWRPYLDELVRHPYPMLGAGVCAIAARRLPSEFVEAVSKMDAPPEELDYPLSIALQRAPAVSGRLEEILPASRLANVQRLAKEPASVVLRNLVLWD